MKFGQCIVGCFDFCKYFEFESQKRWQSAGVVLFQHKMLLVFFSRFLSFRANVIAFMVQSNYVTFTVEGFKKEDKKELETGSLHDSVT